MNDRHKYVWSLSAAPKTWRWPCRGLILRLKPKHSAVPATRKKVNSMPAENRTDPKRKPWQRTYLKEGFYQMQRLFHLYSPLESQSINPYLSLKTLPGLFTENIQRLPLPATSAHKLCWIRKFGIMYSNFCLRVQENQFAKSCYHVKEENQCVQLTKGERRISSKFISLRQPFSAALSWQSSTDSSVDWLSAYINIFSGRVEVSFLNYVNSWKSLPLSFLS